MPAERVSWDTPLRDHRLLLPFAQLLETIIPCALSSVRVVLCRRASPVAINLLWPEAESQMCCNEEFPLERQVREDLSKEQMMTRVSSCGAVGHLPPKGSPVLPPNWFL